MKILLAGASGLVGRALIERFGSKHQWFLLGRNQEKLKQKFPDNVCLSYRQLQNFNEPIDAVIHLSGQNIADFVWTKTYRQKLIDSRVNTALQLCQWINRQNQAVKVLAANAIGYYGCYPQDFLHFTEESAISPNPECFSQTITHLWQDAWKQLKDPKQLIIMRFGVVLQKNQGMLKRLTPSFKLGFGSILGDGQQMISWIDIDDLSRAIIFLLEKKDEHGVFNLVAPNPISQSNFAKILAKTLKRPLFLHLPKCLIKMLMGQMGQELLLSGQTVLPQRLSALGFKFKYPELSQSLAKEFD